MVVAHNLARGEPQPPATPRNEPRLHTGAHLIPHLRTVVAIPARDEAARVAACLEALDGQDGARLDEIVLLVNNSSDDTAKIARSVKLLHPTRLHVIECTLSPEFANAGSARRIAMEETARLAGADGVLLTTDADGLVDPDWLTANLAAIRAGADAVAGWVELHPVEWGAIPARLHQDDARECSYDALCDEIHALLDPDPWDPHPRHTHHSGASIAVTASAFAKCGGVPPVPFGEDRALVAALRRIDARVRHAPEVHVTVSGRTTGRRQVAWPTPSSGAYRAPTSIWTTGLNPQPTAPAGRCCVPKRAEPMLNPRSTVAGSPRCSELIRRR